MSSQLKYARMDSHYLIFLFEKLYKDLTGFTMHIDGENLSQLVAQNLFSLSLSLCLCLSLSLSLSNALRMHTNVETALGLSSASEGDESDVGSTTTDTADRLEEAFQGVWEVCKR